ncbi:hypothetical protein V6N13_024230 [Hibiscus sabdariffa]|uniref:Uncharacterized protein n=1 Tax=Hibiscus sabdariffa TaxID=183260 RepID=A0ABR2BX22_9ROSI
MLPVKCRGHNLVYNAREKCLLESVCNCELGFLYINSSIVYHEMLSLPNEVRMHACILKTMIYFLLA